MRYFVGDSIYGAVRAAIADDFQQVIDRYLSMAVPLPISKEEYLALDRKGRDRAKSTSFLVAATFSSSPSKRVYECASNCNLIFLDIDPPKDGGEDVGHRLVSDLDAVYEALDPWNFALYHTASSTPESPRLRVVVSAQGIPVGSYSKAVQTIADALSIGKVNSESKVAVQAMYLPVLFQGQDSDTEHPLLLCESGRRTFTMADIQHTGEAEAKGVKPTSRMTDQQEGVDLLEYLKAPMEGVTLAEVKGMLEHIDPDVVYQEWLTVAAALKHQFPQEEGEAYTLFDEWSAKGSKYVGEDETATKWKTFRQHTIGRAPVTIRTIIHRAALGGYSTNQIKDREFGRLMVWVKNEQSLAALLAEGVTRIAAAPLLTTVEQEGLLVLLMAQAKKLGMTLTLSTLRKQLKEVKALMEHKPDEQRVVTTPPWAKGLCYVAATEEVFRHRNGEKFTLGSFDSVYSRKLLPTAKQLIELGVTVNERTLSTPTILPRQYVLNHLKVQTVWDYTYDPSSPNDLFTLFSGKLFVNTYRRTFPQPDILAMHSAKRVMERHLRITIKEPEYQRVVMDWMAFLVQHPGQKIRWAILLQGAEGSGKTFLSDVMSAVLGREHVQNISGESLFSGFNEWASGKQLVALEEIRVAGVNRHEVMNKLKPLITNDRISVAEKFRSVRDVVNVTNYMAFTNHRDSLTLSNDSRRYFVLQSKLQTREDVSSLLMTDYFDRVYQELETNPGGFRAFFESHEISEDFDPNGSAPRTPYLQQLIEESADPVTEAIRRVIQEGDNPLLQHDLVSSRVLLSYVQENEGLRRATAPQIASVLRSEGYNQLGRFRVGADRHYLWVHNGQDMSRAWDTIAEQRQRHSQSNIAEASKLFEE